MAKCKFLMGNGHKCKNDATKKVGKTVLCETHYKAAKKLGLV
jgi:hypothetical protein